MITKNRILLVLSLVFVFLVFLLIPRDTDLGWHIRYGEEFVKTLNFRPGNFLTYYLTDYKWSNSYTLYQILTYEIYHTFGLFGLSAASGVLGVISFFFFSRIFKKLPVVSLVAFLVIVFFGWNVFHLGFRAQIFTMIGLIVTFLILEAATKKQAVLFSLPPLFFLWANFHGAFVLGLFVLAIFAMDSILAKNFNLTWKVFGILLLACVATLFNPYGPGIYTEALLTQQASLGTQIAEWVPSGTTETLLISAMTLFTFLVITPEKSTNKAFWLTLVSVFAVLAIQARRNIPVFALTAALSLLTVFQSKLANAFENANLQKSALAVLTLGILVVGVIRIPPVSMDTSNWADYCSSSAYPYPCQAIQYLKTQNVRGKNIFSAYEWGGVLEWQLPENKYYVDGRMPAWPAPLESVGGGANTPYTIYLAIIQAQPGYQEILDKYKTDILLIGSGTFLDLELANTKSSPWQEVYRDNTAVIYRQK